LPGKAGSFLRSILDRLNEVEKISKSIPKNWIGKTSKKDDIRVVISRLYDKNRKTTQFEDFERGFAERSLGIEYNAWENDQPGKPGQKHRSVNRWSDKFVDKKSTIRATLRGKTCIAFEKVAGIGIAAFLFLLWWSFIELSDSERDICAAVIAGGDDFGKTRSIIQLCTNFIETSQQQFHCKHSFYHLCGPSSTCPSQKPQQQLNVGDLAVAQVIDQLRNSGGAQPELQPYQGQNTPTTTATEDLQGTAVQQLVTTAEDAGATVPMHPTAPQMQQFEVGTYNPCFQSNQNMSFEENQRKYKIPGFILISLMINR
jgi:hypothetical protein